MIGSASPAMKKYIWKPATWVVKHKFINVFKSKKYSMYENKIVCDYRDGKVTKEYLDARSTCDLNAVVNDGLSKESRAILKNIKGEDFVDKSILEQEYKTEKY